MLIPKDSAVLVPPGVRYARTTAFLNRLVMLAKEAEKLLQAELSVAAFAARLDELLRHAQALSEEESPDKELPSFELDRARAVKERLGRALRALHQRKRKLLDVE